VHRLLLVQVYLKIRKLDSVSSKNLKASSVKMQQLKNEVVQVQRSLATSRRLGAVIIIDKRAVELRWSGPVLSGSKCCTPGIKLERENELESTPFHS
jgi:hypothetical protein